MIRPAVATDAPRLAEIHISSWQAAYAGLLPAEYLDGLSAQAESRTAQWLEWLQIDSDQRQIGVAVDDSDVVGFAHLGPSGDKDLKSTLVGELYAMYLDPARYRQGFGSELMAATFASLREAGFEEGSLWVMTGNDAARSFYERHGWYHDGTESDVCLGITIPSVRYRVEL